MLDLEGGKRSELQEGKQQTESVSIVRADGGPVESGGNNVCHFCNQLAFPVRLGGQGTAYLGELPLHK